MLPSNLNLTKKSKKQITIYQTTTLPQIFHITAQALLWKMNKTIQQQDQMEKKRKILCGTEKGKHKAKNHKTAGNNFIKLQHNKMNNITENPTQCTYICSTFHKTLNKLFPKFI